MKKCAIETTRVIGTAVLTMPLLACGGEVGESGDDIPFGHETLTAPGPSEASARATNKPRGKRYEVVIVDEANLTHEPTAINNRGQIASSARNSEDVRQAWFWDGAEGHFIFSERQDATGTATDVNDKGQVVGGTQFLRDYSDMPGSFAMRTRAFLYRAGALREFGVLSGNSMSRAEAVNQSGDMAGTTFGGPGEQHAVLFLGDQLLDLGRGRALGINRSRQAVGVSNLGDISSEAFLYSGGELTILGTLGGENSVANDINDAGTVVGSAWTSAGTSRGFIHQDGAMSELPVPGEVSTALAINRRGDVVGSFSSPAAPNVFDGYLYRNAEVTPLLDLAQDACWAHLEPRDINDRGDIVGVGLKSSDPSCAPTGRYLIVITQQPSRYR